MVLTQSCTGAVISPRQPVSVFLLLYPTTIVARPAFRPASGGRLYDVLMAVLYYLHKNRRGVTRSGKVSFFHSLPVKMSSRTLAAFQDEVDLTGIIDFFVNADDFPYYIVINSIVVFFAGLSNLIAGYFLLRSRFSADAFE